jgi:hypothetical protein
MSIAKVEQTISRATPSESRPVSAPASERRWTDGFLPLKHPPDSNFISGQALNVDGGKFMV